MKLIERPMARPAVAAMITSERATCIVTMAMDGLPHRHAALTYFKFVSYKSKL